MRSDLDVLILAIETATERIGVALIGSDGIVASFEATRGRHHAEIVVPAIEFVCRHAGVTVNELSAVAVDVGPGLFTGMRVGLATSKAMAQALDVPVIGITSLEVLAFACRHRSSDDDVVVPVVDARKGQVFFGFHRPSSNGVQPLEDIRVGSTADLIAAVEDRGQHIVCVGDGAERYREELASHPLIETADRHLAHPSVQNLAIMALRRALREEWSEPRAVQAVYVRAPDAEINWSTRTSTESAITAEVPS
jgi:tRNA threonylcarbamoyladenosine biosynthesis protein TsaB